MKEAIYNISARLSTAAAMFAVVLACSSENSIVDDYQGEGEPVTVMAEVAQQLHSRGYQPDEPVTEGQYYLSYPKNTTNNPYNVALVDFDRDSGSGIGMVTVPDNQVLKWDDVGGSMPTFYLDNVDPKLASDGTASTKVIFKEENNPYKAGLFDDTNGSNDLLWGEAMVQRNTVKTINFDLHHNMSRVRVQVTANKNGYSNELDLRGATVKISSINQTPLSFNRLDGTLELPTVGDNGNYSEIYTPLVFVDEKEATAEADKIWWKEIEEGENTDVYITEDFVLPPQDLLENEHRPRLTITLANGKVYSGILPHAMEIESDAVDQTKPSTVPSYLSFIKEHILTIRTIITEEPPQLSFMPVWVMAWVDKGEFNLEAHQAGIYTAEEFYKLIDYYTDNNEYQLVRYGSLIADGQGTEKWNFDFFSGVVLEEDRIAGKMRADKGLHGFIFNFNNYTIYIKKTDGSIESVTSQQLYSIVNN